MSGIIAFYIINSLFHRNQRLPDNAVVLALFGLVAGIIGGATNAMSPILMMCLLSMSQNHHEIARAANLCFLLGKISQLVVLHQEAFKLFSSEYLWVVLILTVLSLLSLIIGTHLRTKISPLYFRRFVLVILGGLAIVSAIQSIRVLILS